MWSGDWEAISVSTHIKQNKQTTTTTHHHPSFAGESEPKWGKHYYYKMKDIYCSSESLSEKLKANGMAGEVQLALKQVTGENTHKNKTTTTSITISSSRHGSSSLLRSRVCNRCSPSSSFPPT